VITYSGYSPFVGSGIDIGGWSFILDIDKGKKVNDGIVPPESFSVSELYSFFDDKLDSLNIPNLKVSDKIFINGKKIRNNRDLLPKKLGHPVNHVSEKYIKKIMNEDNTDIRFYRVIQITDWEGDLILTSFLRFQKSLKSIFVENNYFLLPPISEDLKSIDAIKEESGIRYYITWITRFVFISLKDSIMSILTILRYIHTALSSVFGGEKIIMRKVVENSPDFDYGANTSIREAISQFVYSQHFQKLDKERYFKTIEKQIFNILKQFLDEKSIDSSEFQERETNIINNGVLVTGGDLKGNNFATGKKSKISSSKKQYPTSDEK
jgi:hypothetical protein